MLSVVTNEQSHAELATDLDELVREGARRMLAAALEAEVDAYLAAHTELTDERGHRLVRRNGHAPARTLSTAAGQVEVVRPRVDDRRVDPATGERVQFQSVILPRWCRRSPKVAEVLPLLYLHGLSSLDFVPALERFFGASAGLSASVITRLATQWQAEREAFLQRDLGDRDYVCCWADGIHFNIRLRAVAFAATAPAQRDCWHENPPVSLYSCSALCLRRFPVPTRGDRHRGPLVPALRPLVSRHRGTSHRAGYRG
jgi:transposase-like protein